MFTVTAVLALIAGLLFVISLIPQTHTWPLVSVGGLLLSIALFMVGKT